MTDLLHSNILGSGTPLIVLHGFLGMSDNWKTLGKQYATQGFEVHLVDQRNHGRSFWSDVFDYPTLAQDLLHYMDSKNLAKAVMLGHSMGGKTAMQFACTKPERVSKLLVADIAPRPYPPHHDYILEALEAHGISEETLIIFTSDNGCSPEANYQELAEYGHNPSYVFRGHKADIYEGGHRVPFVVRWPGKIKEATESHQVICLTDLLATVADITGASMSSRDGADSYSLLRT